MKCLALGRMRVECGRCNAQGAQGAPSALGRQIFVADVCTSIESLACSNNKVIDWGRLLDLNNYDSNREKNCRFKICRVSYTKYIWRPESTK